MLIAIALVVLQAVKRVPSKTLLLGAHVILMLRSVSFRYLILYAALELYSIMQGELTATQRPCIR